MYAAYCEDCQEFLELNKWNPAPHLSDLPQDSARRAYQCVQISAESLLHSMELNTDPTGFKELRDSLQAFVKLHSDHQIGLCRSSGDWPWWPDEKDWFVWRRVVGPFYHPSVDQSDIDLPRNIIYDLGIIEWPQALKHYRLRCPCVEFPEKIEQVFKRYSAS